MKTKYTPRVARDSASASGAAREVTGPTVAAVAHHFVSAPARSTCSGHRKNGILHRHLQVTRTIVVGPAEKDGTGGCAPSGGAPTWLWTEVADRRYGRMLGAGRAVVQSGNARRGGTIFGFGDRQLSLHGVQVVWCDSITVIAMLDSLHLLGGPPRFDIGGPECQGFLGGLVRVITGEPERAMWQVAT
jgi:hypothetical protein